MVAFGDDAGQALGGGAVDRGGGAEVVTLAVSVAQALEVDAHRRRLGAHEPRRQGGGGGAEDDAEAASVDTVDDGVEALKGEDVGTGLDGGSAEDVEGEDVDPDGLEGVEIVVEGFYFQTA